MSDFCMPSLGADMDAGTLVEWKVKPGDHVKKGDLIATVETVKGAIDVEVFHDGVVEKLLVEPGTTVPVGTPLARMGEAAPEAAALSELAKPAPIQPGEVAGGEAPLPEQPRPEVPPRPAPSAPLAQPSAEWSPSTQAPPPKPSGPHHRASPVARRMAHELGVDLTVVHGSGPGGAVLKADVEAAAGGAPVKEAAPAPVPAKRFDTSAMRKAIGAAMSRSKREIPHYYLATEIDLSRALHWMQAYNADRPVAERLLPAALLLKAVALAAKEVPEVNGTFTDGFVPSEAVNLGVAIHLKGGGLVAPGVREAQTLAVPKLMQRLTDLVTRARAGRLTTAEMGGQTLTVTNLGDLGVTSAFAVIIPPQVAMVGFGKVQTRPWVVDGGSAIGPRPIVVASLAADHRVSNGHRGARFLGVLEELLEQPEAL